MKKKNIFIVVIIVILIGISAFIWYSLSSKTNFKALLDNDLNDVNEITHIVIDKNDIDNNESFWATIEQEELLSLVVSKMEEIELKEKITNKELYLDNTMTIHTIYATYFYDYNSNSIIADGKQYEVLEGNFESFINDLVIEWETPEEFMED
ncbi:hypothetical protein ACFQ4N_17815 [Oceanobacillus iheyensis]|uniref:hypothetical protein n=1 Tax=Oceanobacillus iheyensis TaxID=182710 RepID=UPI0036289A07